MSNEWAPAPPPRAPRKWPKRLLWTGVGLFVVILVGYFVVTSSMFFKGLILPKVSQALNAEVTVSAAHLSPFSRMTLEDLEVRASRLDEPILKAREVTARYSLWSMLGGNIRVGEILVDSPSLTIIEFADGRRNIDPLLAGASPTKPSTAETPIPEGESTPPQVELTNFLLTNATVRVLQHKANGGRDTLTISQLHVSLTELANGQIAGLNLGAGIRLDHVPSIGATNDQPTTLRVNWQGGFQCWMSQELQPEALKGAMTLDVLEAPTSFSELVGLQAKLDTELSLSRITQVQLAFRQGEADLGRVRLSGPLSVARQEGQVRLEVSGIDRRALNLAGAALGLDFGATTLNATNDVQFSVGGQVISLKGNLFARQLGVTTEGKSTVPLDLVFDYELNLDQPAQSALVQAFSLAGHQGTTPIIQGGLSQPMKLSWSETGSSLGLEESAFSLIVTNFNLSDWKAFLGDYDGMISSVFQVQAGAGGQQISLSLDSTGQGMAMTISSNRLENVALRLRVRSQLDNFRKARFEEIQVGVQHHDQTAVTANLSGTYDFKLQEADLQALLTLDLPGVAGLLPQPDFSPSSGEVRLITSLRQKNLTPGETNQIRLDQTVTGDLRLVDFSGRHGEWVFQALESKTDFQAGLKDGEAQLTQWTTTFQQKGQPAGTLQLSGHYALTNQIAQVSMKVEDLNEHLLQSFLPQSTNGSVLTSIHLGLQTEGYYDSQGASTLKTDLKVANLRLPGTTAGSSTDPIGINFNLDASWEKGVARLREWQGAFLGNGRPAGTLVASGEYDVSNQTGRVSFDLENLDQQFLAPLLAQALGDKTLSNALIRVGFKASYDAAQESVLDGEIRLENFVIHDPTGSLPRAPLAVSLKLNGGMRDEQARLQFNSGDVRLGGELGGQFSLAGSYHMKTGAGEARLGLTDFNQKLLGPFLAASLDGKELASLSINSDLSASIDPEGETRLTGSLKASDFLIRDPKTNVVLKPLAAELALNVGLNPSLISLDSVRLGLSPTVRARNELILTGRIDLTDTNAMGGNLKLVAESLDLTPYYDFFVAQPPPSMPEEEEVQPEEEPKAEKREPTPPPGGTGEAPQEPEAMTLPFREFRVEADIGRFFLREIQLSDWQTKVLLDGGKVVVNPLAMTVNEAPLKMELDLNVGVPGYRYNLLFNADRIPLEPLANTLIPESHGQYKGDLIADLQIKGAGTTGKNLRTNLNGRVNFSLTNAVVKITQRSAKAVLLPIAVLLRSPDLLKSPVTWVGADVTLGEGKIHLHQVGAISPVFAGGTTGDIPIADNLMESSINKLPVKFYLERELAKRAKVLPRGTPKEDSYVRLPDFVFLIGNLSEPASQLDKVALTGSILQKMVDPRTAVEEPTSSANPFDFFAK